tara:strand:- start:189 stop:458 length:270 start_codon:yes stop_codon:yes gene_type:complete
MKVKIQQRSVYHKFAEVEIEIDKKDYKEYHDLHDYLLENEQLYNDKIDKAISEADYEFGSGANDYDGMDDNSDSEWRYDCEDLKTGGHL